MTKQEFVQAVAEDIQMARGLAEESDFTEAPTMREHRARQAEWDEQEEFESDLLGPLLPRYTPRAHKQALAYANRLEAAEPGRDWARTWEVWSEAPGTDYAASKALWREAGAE